MTYSTQHERCKVRRKQIFVDADIQGALLRQLVVNWLLVLGVLATVLLVAESYKADFTLGFLDCLAAMWSHNSALVIALAILAPIISYDSVKLSHRFVGPMVSLRRALSALGEGQHVEPLRFRKGDFWGDVAERFNTVVARINRLEAERRQTESGSNRAEAAETVAVS